MKRIPLLALMGLLALPVTGALQAQQPSEQTHAHADSLHRDGPRPGMRGTRGAMRGGFAGRLLAQRSQLNLTDRQVTQLTAIRDKYQERNQALMTQARGARTDADRQRMQAERKAARERMQAERQEYLKAHPEVRKAMDQLRENRKNEQKDVESVLTAEQKSMIKQRMERMQQFQRQGGRAWGRDSAPASR
jgi:Spy/CpxP family protein refolding chaperone